MIVNNITFTFVNGDCITIHGKYIGYFLVDDTHSSVQKLARNYVKKLDTAGTIALEIHKDANIIREEFGIEERRQQTFDRLTYNDITSIEVEYSDEDAEKTEAHTYYTNWVGDSAYENKAQSFHLSSSGNLYRVISEGEKVNDIFTEEYINNIESISTHFSTEDNRIDEMIQECRDNDLNDIADYLQDYKHVKKWKEEIIEEFCKRDVSSFEELIEQVQSKTINEFANKLLYEFGADDIRDTIKEIAKEIIERKK